MKTVLITGASGFVGRNCCRRWRAAGWRVIALARTPEGDVEADRWLGFDLGGGRALPELGEPVDTIVHLAGRAHALAETVAEIDAYEQTNVQGTKCVAEAAVRYGARALVAVSTVKVFGEAQQRADRGLNESDSPLPDTPYGHSKFVAEQIVLGARSVPHRVVVRPALMYGPGVKGNLARLWSAVAAGRFPPLPETGRRRSLLHCEDLCDLLARAAVEPAAAGKIFHATDGCPLSAREMLDAVRRAQGRPPVRWPLPVAALWCAAWTGDVLGLVRRRRMPLDSDSLRKLVGPAWFDSSRLAGELGWHPRRAFREAAGELRLAA